jgi:hypothetical protein
LIGAAQDDLPTLLERAGARLRGKRFDCPECKRFRSGSFTETVFCCHGIGCEFKGGIGTLCRRLNITRTWLPLPEYRRRQRQQARAAAAARALYARVRARHMQLLGALRYLDHLQAEVSCLGPGDEGAWSALASSYRQRLNILAELSILENCPATDLVRFLVADGPTREAAIDRVRCGQVWLPRTLRCPHCGALVGRDLLDPDADRRFPQPGRCPGACTLGCSGACRACKGKGTITVPEALEVRAGG